MVSCLSGVASYRPGVESKINVEQTNFLLENFKDIDSLDFSGLFLNRIGFGEILERVVC